MLELCSLSQASYQASYLGCTVYHQAPPWVPLVMHVPPVGNRLYQRSPNNSGYSSGKTLLFYAAATFLHARSFQRYAIALQSLTLKEPLLLYITPKVYTPKSLHPNFPGKQLPDTKFCNDLTKRTVVMGWDGFATIAPRP